MGKFIKIGLGLIVIELIALFVFLINLMINSALYGWDSLTMIIMSGEFFIATVLVAVTCMVYLLFLSKHLIANKDVIEKDTKGE